MKLTPRHPHTLLYTNSQKELFPIKNKFQNVDQTFQKTERSLTATTSVRLLLSYSRMLIRQKAVILVHVFPAFLSDDMAKRHTCNSKIDIYLVRCHGPDLNNRETDRLTVTTARRKGPEKPKWFRKTTQNQTLWPRLESN